MTQREMILEALLFGNPDKIPFRPGNGRKSTRERWYKEGLPRDTACILTEAFHQAGGKGEVVLFGPSFGVNERMIPYFDQKVIEVKENSQIVQDWKGNICEIGLEFDVSYLLTATDFVTRRWVKCPVENRNDWELMKERYDSDAIERMPENADELSLQLKERDHFVEIHFSGPYWQLREWLGFEGLCVMFYDDPELIKDMISFWENHVLRLMERTFKYIIPDSFHISEDMAYKSFSMLSPDMTREFLYPTWKKWVDFAKSAGIPLRGIDSDGFIGELIPIWIDAGFNTCDPIEVAAGNDIIEFRNSFGKKMSYRGGVDKREMAKGGVHIENEMKRLEPVIRAGGFIPSCDHGVPSDVSWPDFVYYVKLLAETTGWML